MYWKCSLVDWLGDEATETRIAKSFYIVSINARCGSHNFRVIKHPSLSKLLGNFNAIVGLDMDVKENNIWGLIQALQYINVVVCTA